LEVTSSFRCDLAANKRGLSFRDSSAEVPLRGTPAALGHRRYASTPQVRSRRYVGCIPLKLIAFAVLLLRRGEEILTIVA
jgi:hypothetical protein